MEKRQYLRFNMFFMKLVGMYNVDKKNSAWKAVYFMWRLICVTLTLSLTLQCVVDIIEKDTSSLIEVTSNILNACIYLGGTARLTYFIYNAAKIKRLYETINESFLYEYKSPFQTYKMKKHLSLANKIAVVWYLNVIFAVQLAVVLPLLLQQRNKRTLPIPAWYPWDVSRTPFFEISLFLQESCTIIMGVIYANVDVSFASCALLTAGQYELLGFALENVVVNSSAAAAATNTKKTRGYDATFAERMKTKEFETVLGKEYEKCVKIHWNLSDCVKQMESLYAPINSYTLLFILFYLIFLAFTFINTVEYSGALFKVQYFVSAILEGLIFTYFGQLIATKNEETKRKHYETPWYLYSKKIKSVFRVIQIRLEQPVKLTAGKVVPLTLSSLLEILRTAYSYYAVLRNITNKETKQK